MAKVVKASQLSKSIADILSEFNDVTSDTLSEVKKATAFEGRRLVRDRSNVDTGDYRKGWRYKKTKGTKDTYVIYNKTDWQLTHLLEKGHAKVGGGLTKAYPHIGPTADDLAKGIIGTFVKEFGR